MKYQDFEGSINELVSLKVKEIEAAEHVTILHAVESGSRAWGFASPDSDYDVRFIYVRPQNAYLELQPRQDFIDWALDETLDLNGWDLPKALQHFHKSNATLFEWAGSPVVYHTTPAWQNIYAAARHYFSCKSAMYHYYGTARKNYHEHLTGALVKYKKYFYVLRPLLACRWIAKKACPPPVLFQELADAVLPPELTATVSQLLTAKMQMAESDRAPRVDLLDAYIEKELAYYKEAIGAMPDDRTPDWGALNAVFLAAIGVVL
ncbi:MAG: nucleotidyltransferase domain-containing protein [Lachnospiraceae bacterium]|nr:nucleotidyltransferase domain-containing protein [Lachnospiraceae bacterium]